MGSALKGKISLGVGGGGVANECDDIIVVKFTDCEGYIEKHGMEMPSHTNRWYHIYLAIRQGFSLPRMTTNN